MDSVTLCIFLTSKLTLLLRPVRQAFLEQRSPVEQLAAGSDCDVSRSFAAVDDEDMDDIAIAADLALMLRH